MGCPLGEDSEFSGSCGAWQRDKPLRDSGRDPLRWICTLCWDVNGAGDIAKRLAWEFMFKFRHTGFFFQLYKSFIYYISLETV